MKKIAAIFLTFAMCIVFFEVPAVHAGSSTLTLQTSTPSVAVGDDFTVEVYVDPAGASLDTVRGEISFDPNLLQASHYDMGSLFPYPAPANVINNTDGLISYGAYKYGDGVTEAGTSVTIHFTALADGEAIVNVLETSKLISDGEEQLDSSALSSLTITIGSGSSTTTDVSLEEQALVYFGAFFARMPSNGTEWEALHCIAYGGCQGDPRDINAEAAALELFGQKYATMPSTQMEWNVLHTIAYTDLLTYDQAQ